MAAIDHNNIRQTNDLDQISSYFATEEPFALSGAYSSRIRSIFHQWETGSGRPPRLEREGYMEGDRQVYERIFGDDYLFHVRVRPYEPTGADGYAEIDRVILRNAASKVPRTLLVFKKAITGGSMAADLQKTALDHQQKLAAIRDLGIATPEIYAVEHATLYEEHIPDETRNVLSRIYREESGWEQLLGEIVRIAHRIDRSDFSAPQLLSDLLYDGKRFVFVDGGQDLSRDADKTKTDCLAQLCRNWQLAKHEDWMRSRYRALEADDRKRAA